jgi:demethylmenaquinone methyltransferase/2-methoxy-6-polyprenyl-1,4-benzoquinol methylase
MPIPSTTVTAPPAKTASAAWSDRDLAANPHARSDKPERVRRMFAAIARSYDLNNRLHSLWQDQAWRRFAVRQARVQPTDIALDAACGTGDLSQALARAGAAKVIGLDFTFEMLEIARHKAGGMSPRDNPDRITYIQGDAQSLPIPDASVDIVTIAFGIRNVLEPLRAIAEFRRILRPGGRLVILEFAEPRFALVRWFNSLYCRQIMPRTATWISRDKSGAYKYLPKSVETFLSPEQLQQAILNMGFGSVEATPLSLGICMCYSASV